MDTLMKFLKKNELFIRILLVIANIVLLNLLAQNIFFRIDMTDENIYSLAEASKNAVGTLDDRLVVKAYFSEDLPYPYNNYKQFLRDKLDEYKSYSQGQLTYEFVDPGEDENLESEAQKYGIPAVQVNAVEKDKLEVKKVFMGAAFLYEDKSEVLPVIQSTQGLEYDITSAINQLTTEDKKNIAFLKGNGEPNLREKMSVINGSLSKRYDVAPLELKDDRTVSADVDVLIVARPTESLSEWEQYAIDQYIMGGGKVAFLIDKVDADIQQSQATAMNLQIDDWCSNYGFKVNNDLVYDAQCSRVNVSQRSGFMVIQNVVQYPFFPIINYFERDNVMVRDLEGVVLPFVSSIDTTLATDKGLTLQVLATTSEKAGTQRYRYNIGPMQKFTNDQFTESHIPLAAVVTGKFKSFFAHLDHPPNPFEEGTAEAASFEEDYGDLEVVKECQEENRIVVFGDGEFMLDDYLRGSNVNGALFMNMVDWLAQSEDLISIRSRGVSSRPIKEISAGARTAIKWANVLVVPILVIIAGLVYRKIRRKRKMMELEKL